MDKSSIFLIILCIFLAGSLAIMVNFLIRRKASIKKVCAMKMSEKIRLLDELANPFGFSYLQKEDVFAGRIDAVQRAAGYEALFDKAAAHFHMIIDACPVYFDYEERTWLIELWKGQYGITTGAEVGIYHTDGIVEKNDRRRTHFQAAEDQEMPLISYCLEKKGKKLFDMEGYHWWLAAFRAGEFSQPKDLKLTASITFETSKQAECFCKGLVESGYFRNKFCRKCNEVCVQMDFTMQHTKVQKIYYAFIQIQNRICCRLYRFVTRPFCHTVDRILFLYFQLPRCFRWIMKRLICKKRHL